MKGSISLAFVVYKFSMHKKAKYIHTRACTTIIFVYRIIKEPGGTLQAAKAIVFRSAHFTKFQPFTHLRKQISNQEKALERLLREIKDQHGKIPILFILSCFVLFSGLYISKCVCVSFGHL